MRTAVASAARKTRTRTLAADLARLARRCAAEKPVDLAIYVDDRVGFQRDVLGWEPVEPQIAVYDAMAKSDRVAVPSGRAVGKSRLDAGAALHFAATHANACVVLIAPTFKQIQVILWEELRTLYFSAKVPLGGECAKLASTGLRLPNGSRVFGITGDSPEALQGIRAAHMLVIVDEASGVDDGVFVALEGNLAGGGQMLLTGNPTRSSGAFRDACKGERYTVVPLPSTSSPNIIAGRIVVGGLATIDWLNDRKREWGEDSPLYKIHVLGLFVELEEGRLFSEDMIATAELRWSANDNARGRLVIGCDPAGEGGAGDESAFAARRGKRILAITTRRGLSAEGHVVELCGILRMHGSSARSEVRPLVVVDRDGYVGAKVFAELVAYQSQHEDEFELLGVRGGERASRQPKSIDRVRDEVWLHLVDWLRGGGELPEDIKLKRDLSAIKLEQHISGRSKIIGKDELRRELGRSPDRGDAVSLAVWGSDEDGDDVPTRKRGTEELPEDGADPYALDPSLDPYEGAMKWARAA